MAVKKSTSELKKVVAATSTSLSPQVKKPPRDTSPVKTAFTKAQILAEISRASLLSKKDVSSVLEELSYLISRHVKKDAVGLFNMPGLFKVTTVNKPAIKARKGINPFNGEEMMFKAKPATKRIKIRPLKGLKDMV